VSVVLDRIGAPGAGAPGEVVDGPWVSTVELGQQGALTLYRRLQAGAHPDVELTAGIADRLRGTVVAADSVWRSHPYDLASVRRTGRGGTVAVIDLKHAPQLVTEVPVGTRPWGMALSTDGKRLYTANGPSDDVSIVDTATLKTIRKIPVGRSPWGVVLAP